MFQGATVSLSGQTLILARLRSGNRRRARHRLSMVNARFHCRRGAVRCPRRAALQGCSQENQGRRRPIEARSSRGALDPGGLGCAAWPGGSGCPSSVPSHWGDSAEPGSGAINIWRNRAAVVRLRSPSSPKAAGWGTRKGERPSSAFGRRSRNLASTSSCTAREMVGAEKTPPARAQSCFWVAGSPRCEAVLTSRRTQKASTGRAECKLRRMTLTLPKNRRMAAASTSKARNCTSRIPRTAPLCTLPELGLG